MLAPSRSSARAGAKPKTNDPFADLESLEAEMARLLGRGKPGKSAAPDDAVGQVPSERPAASRQVLVHRRAPRRPE